MKKREKERERENSTRPLSIFLSIAIELIRSEIPSTPFKRTLKSTRIEMIYKYILSQEEDERSMKRLEQFIENLARKMEQHLDWVLQNKGFLLLLLVSLVSYSRREPIRDASLYTRLLLTFVIIF